MEEKKEFKTEYTLDLKTYREFSRGYLAAKRTQLILLCIFVLCCAGSVVDGNYGVVIGFCGLWLLLVILAMVCGRNSISYKRSLVANGGKPLHHTVTLKEEEILMEDNHENRTSYTYEQVTGILETNNLLILKLPYNLGIILSKKEIEGGTKEELVAYLLSKCSQRKSKKIIQTRKYEIFQKIVTGCIACLFLIAVILLGSEKTTLLRWEKKLEKNGYEVTTEQIYDRGRTMQEMKIFLSGQKGKAYVYECSDAEEAESYFQDRKVYEWEMLDPEEDEWDKMPNQEVETNMEQKYEMQRKDQWITIIQKGKYVFQGESNLTEKKELDAVAELLGF